jgi:hypothetical protein
MVIVRPRTASAPVSLSRGLLVPIREPPAISNTEVTVALQGTIETFALPDVLRLLASTKKTGRLQLDGSRGSGSIWVETGTIVGGEASGAPHAAGSDEVLFEMLRFKEGDFVFDADTDIQMKHAPVEVEPALDTAEKMLDEWKSIESVVPSLDHRVQLAPKLKGDEITIGADRWKTIVAVAGGTTVGALGDTLELGELPVSRNVKELVEMGLVTIDEPSAGGAAARPAPPKPEVEEPAPVISLTPPPPDAPTADDDVFDPNDLVIEEPSVPAMGDVPPSSTPSDPFGVPATSDPSDAAEIARQLANLSPKAAKAVAAAAKATTPEERERALAEVDDDEDPINRDLLIKFLGSVNS